jgi:hypothetical protein
MYHNRDPPNRLLASLFQLLYLGTEMNTESAMRSIQIIELELANLKQIIQNEGQAQPMRTERSSEGHSSEGRSSEERSSEGRSSEGRSSEEPEHENVDGSPDRRFKENRSGPTGQGEVKHPESDRRLKENRPDSNEEDRDEKLRRLEELTHGKK